MKKILQTLGSEIDAELLQLAKDRRPDELYDSVRYVLSGGGKRIRPILLLLVARVFGVSTKEAMPLALAVELVHNFSLVHDDIMDHAPSRRGRETVHVKWNTDTAILCGDVILAMASECTSQVTSVNSAEITRVFGNMVCELCEGQALDMAIEAGYDPTTQDYLHMVDGKTGGLFAASLEMGGIAGGADPQACSALRDAGRFVGRAFQIQDDLLDLIADDQRWGKVKGGDLIEGKGTYLLTEARHRATAEDAEFFAKIRPGAGLDKEEIPHAHARMEALGILEDAQELASTYTRQAISKIDVLPGDTEDLSALINFMGARIY